MTTIASFYKIKKNDFARLVSELENNHIEVIDLQKKDSCKPHFFPRTEKVLSYKDNTILPDEVLNTKKRFIFGANVCDAYAPHILDSVFNEEPKDKFYGNRRINTLLAATLCDAKDVACFCDQVIPTNEFLSAADLIFSELDTETYAVKNNSQKALDFFGENFTYFKEDNSLKDFFSNKQTTLFASKNPEGSYQIPKVEELKTFLEKSFDSEIFNDASMSCIGCATCTYNCPTCHCFDIVDEKTYSKGERRKNWDSCAFSLFTLHASGHNPRDHQGKRWRQRLLHKFSIYKNKFNKIACVGCGRCVRLCPAGVNMLEMFQKWKISIDHP